jgi:integrase
MYIRSRKPLGVEATTIHGYEIAAKRIYSRFEGVLARELTSYAIQDYVSDMNEIYKPKTIRNTISLLSAAYDNAVRLEQLASNPCKNVTLPKKDQTEIDIFNEEQIFTFLAQLKKERIDYKVAYELALFCGLRRSEIAGLRESSIDFENGSVSISKTRHEVNGETIIQGTKTENSHRVLAVPGFVLDDIEKMIEMHNAVQYKHTDYLVQDGFGKPIGMSALSSQIYRIEDKAGLPHVSLHDLRHTFASMLHSNHIDMAMISRELGHSNLGTTMNIYTHAFGDVAEASRGIADSLNNKFEKAPKPATFLPPFENKKTAEA